MSRATAPAAAVWNRVSNYCRAAESRIPWTRHATFRRQSLAEILRGARLPISSSRIRRTARSWRYSRIRARRAIDDEDRVVRRLGERPVRDRFRAAPPRWPCARCVALYGEVADQPVVRDDRVRAALDLQIYLSFVRLTNSRPRPDAAPAAARTRRTPRARTRSSARRGVVAADDLGPACSRRRGRTPD